MIPREQSQPMVDACSPVTIAPTRPITEAAATIQAPSTASRDTNVLFIHQINPEEAELLRGDIEDGDQED